MGSGLKKATLRKKILKTVKLVLIPVGTLDETAVIVYTKKIFNWRIFNIIILWKLIL